MRCTLGFPAGRAGAACMTVHMRHAVTLPFFSLQAQRGPMGLAQALKRKLGGGHANGQQKRPCQPAGSQPPPSAVADAGEAVRQQLANGGFAALLASHTGKSTRTAQRKQRNMVKQARQQAAQGQQHQQQQRQGRHGAAAGSGSDSEGDGFAAIANGAATRGAAQAAAGDGEEGQQQGAPAGAYSRLLGSLRSGGGAFTEALQQRQREQAGDSDASSGDEDEDAPGSDGEEGGSDSQGLSGSDLSGGEEDEGQHSQGGSEDEELGEEAEEGLQGGSADEAGGSRSSEEEEDEGQEQQQQAQQEQQEQPRRHLSEGQADVAAAEAAAAAAAVEDHYLEHFEWCACQPVSRAWCLAARQASAWSGQLHTLPSPSHHLALHPARAVI